MESLLRKSSGIGLLEDLDLHDPVVKKKALMQRSTRLSFSVAIVCIAVSPAVGGARKTSPGKPPVAATIETTLGTASKQIRQLAFDGDNKTYFLSVQDLRTTDHFTLVFDESVAITSITVITGRPDGSDKLGAGKLQASTDGKTFHDRANFSDGEAFAVPGDHPIRAIRVKPATDLKHPVAIRELKIESEPPVAIFKYPVEFIVDVTDAPEMKDWAEKVAQVCVRAYPMINEELKSEGYKPPQVVSMTLKKGDRGVASASGSRITGSVSYFKAHPADVGAMVHETTHIVQRYRGRDNPGWLVEGVSDYVRFFKFEPGKIGRINPDRAHYNSSYRVTAAFLAYVTDKYDRKLVLTLNKLMREGHYKEEVFKQLTGKTVQELDVEWRASLRR
ncbi:MAG: basic secretory protein-like protein [Isosphaerales bacterium]